MPRPFLVFSQSSYLIRVVDINSRTSWQTVQIKISWLLIWVYTVCKDRTYPGSAGLGLRYCCINEYMYSCQWVQWSVQYQILICLTLLWNTCLSNLLLKSCDKVRFCNHILSVMHACVHPSVNNFFKHLLNHWLNLTKLHKNHPWLVLFQSCSNGSGPLYI